MFITIEGGEGAGKSTSIEFIENYLKKAGKTVLVTREPGGTAVGEKLRGILLDAKQQNIDASTELLLMFAARNQHIVEIIQPALDAGKWVICDRFTDATYAYQGGGRNINTQRIGILEDWVQGELRPDMTLLLDISVEAGLERARERNVLDRFEQEETEFFERVRACYLEMAAASPNRYRIIDAAQTIGLVQKQISHVLDTIIRETVVDRTEKG